MKSILMSNKPEECVKTLNGDRTIAVRKTAPKDWMDYISGKAKKKPEPRTVYVCCTQGRILRCRRAKETGVKFWTSKYNSKTAMFAHEPMFNGRVIAKFTLRKIEEVERYTSEDFGVYDRWWEEYGTAELDEDELLKLSCLEKHEIGQYLKWEKSGYAHGYAWYITNLEIFDEPKDVRSFIKPSCVEKAKNYIMTCPFVNLLQKDMPKEFEKFVIMKAPVSWCYVEAGE